MENSLLRIEEVAMLIGRSTNAINYWYRWAKDHPEEELAKLLPEFIQVGARQTRYWKSNDVWRLIEFRQRIPQGRNGIMRICEKYYHKKEKTKNDN